MKLEEVFKVNGVPTVTFVEPPEFNKILVNLRTAGRCLLIEGPSGIGKTTAVVQALEKLGANTTPLVLSARKPNDVDLIRALPSMTNIGLVVVDDFHRLAESDQRVLADLMKTLADDASADSKLVTVGINDAGRSLIQFSPDLVNRIDTIKFEATTTLSDKVETLLRKGEQALHIELGIRPEIVEASAGSFYLAQLLAYEACLKVGVLETCSETKDLALSFEDVRREVIERLARSFADPVKLFASGTRVRREGRAPYLHLLKWLSEIDGFSLNINDAIRKHPEMQGSVSQIVEKGYVSQLIANTDGLSRCLHFQDNAGMLYAEDPQFMYYLRNIPWVSYAHKLGFGSIQFESKYDFALSFAGEDREVAEALFNELTHRETEVFYDRNEQHRIAGNDVEEYLAPIYSSEAAHVLVLLSASYPKKIWTKFESQQFAQRMGSGAVIPIWFDGQRAPLWDAGGNIGALTFDPTKDLSAQVASIADVLCKKLTDSR